MRRFSLLKDIDWAYGWQALPEISEAAMVAVSTVAFFDVGNFYTESDKLDFISILEEC